MSIVVIKELECGSVKVKFYYKGTENSIDVTFVKSVTPRYGCNVDYIDSGHGIRPLLKKRTRLPFKCFADQILKDVVIENIKEIKEVLFYETYAPEYL